ncbi:MAG: hypothetical protein N4A37_10255 [Prolixibacteraceae bacterium]|jgi:hypothetical protein|nr:hypothetical protein [Prolixibacteraceae bacterium]
MRENWDNNWSEYIKTSLNQYEPEVPNEIWNNLETNLNKTGSTNKNKLSKIIANITLSICVIGSVYYFFTKRDGLKDVTSYSNPINQHHRIKNDIIKKLNYGGNVIVENNKEIIIKDEKNRTQRISTFKNFKNTIKSNKVVKQNHSSKKKTIKLNPEERNFQIPKRINIKYIKPKEITYQLSNNKIVLFETSATAEILSNSNSRKKIKRNIFLYSIGGGIHKFSSWNGFLATTGEYRFNKLGIYGGVKYYMNNIRNITSGEGANEDTVNEITRSIIQHRISFIAGINPIIWNKSNYHILINLGVTSKSLALNVKGGTDSPFTLSTGVEFRMPIFKKYITSINYNYLLGLSDRSKQGHSIGFKILLTNKKRRK